MESPLHKFLPVLGAPSEPLCRPALCFTSAYFTHTTLGRVVVLWILITHGGVSPNARLAALITLSPSVAQRNTR